MRSSEQFLNASEAARRLGVSVKALRLYEQRGLISPSRTQTGWRAYGPVELSRAAEIVALRALGFSLAQIGRTLDGGTTGLEAALAAHQTALDHQLDQMTRMIEKVRRLRDDLARGDTPDTARLADMMKAEQEVSVSFDLPWPWGGERFELRYLRPLTYITGPLGSGKTRFALRLAETLLDAGFIGLDRLADNQSAAHVRLKADTALKSRVDRTLAWLAEDGATASDALVTLLGFLEDEVPAILVIDMVEQGLDQPSQEALIGHLRRRGPSGRPICMLTRSSSILDPDAVWPEEAIIVCPANHGPPMLVAPHPGCARLRSPCKLSGYAGCARPHGWSCRHSPEPGFSLWSPHNIAARITKATNSNGMH